jgi:murein DD-endopeptidase MepM/ murein hydrolase activator NlpD
VRKRFGSLASLGALAWVLAMPAAQARVVIVVAGDTLEAIAHTYGVSLEALIQRNGIRDPSRLQIGQTLVLPEPQVGSNPKQPALGRAESIAPPPPPPGRDGSSAAALLLSPAERRDRAEIDLRDQSGRSRWKWFSATAVDWAGWTLHPGGVRITLVKPAIQDVGLRTSGATAIAVQCESLRQTWRIDGSWSPWTTPAPGSIGQRIVLDLCSNTLEGPAVPVAPLP